MINVPQKADFKIPGNYTGRLYRELYTWTANSRIIYRLTRIYSKKNTEETTRVETASINLVCFRLKKTHIFYMMDARLRASPRHGGAGSFYFFIFFFFIFFIFFICLKYLFPNRRGGVPSGAAEVIIPYERSTINV